MTSHVRGLFAARAGVPESPEVDPWAGAPPWLSELSAPPALAQWASSFGDLMSCWDACADPEWLLWLAARTCDPGEQRGQVVLCAADIAELAWRGAHGARGARGADPRVTRAISAARMSAAPGSEAIDLVSAERGALDAAQESARAAERDAERALALFRAAPRRRPGSSGMSRALGAGQRCHEEERASSLAMAAASAALAAALAADPAVTAGEWAGCVSRSAHFTLRAMTAGHPPGGRPGRADMRHCVRIVRQRLTRP